MAEEHVRGRMPLESNPGNRNPAIPPVFDTTGKEDYRRVTPENPLPTKDKDLDERLTAIENKLDSVIENGSLNTQLTGSNVEDGITTKRRAPEIFYENDFKVSAMSWAEYNSFNKDLKHGHKADMRNYTDYYFGAQTFGEVHDFHILVRQKPHGTRGSIAINHEYDRGGTVQQIEKTPISFHNVSLRVYNNSDKEQSYTVACGFWPI